MKDNWAIVLDYLQNGYPTQTKSHPVAQVIGTENFNLLEVIPREDATFEPMDKVYIGEGKRDQIKSVIGRIYSSKLTKNAKIWFEFAIRNIITTQEKKFVDILNKMGPTTILAHSLDFIGLSHSKRDEFLKEREKCPFKSFQDISLRTNIDVVPLIIKHILLELDNISKYYFFLNPPKEEPKQVFLYNNKGVPILGRNKKKKKVILKTYPRGIEPYEKGGNYTTWENLPRGWWSRKKRKY